MAGSSRFDPNLTRNVIEAMGPKTSPRMRVVMSALIQHVHDFAREVELSIDEWMMGVQFLNAVGQISDPRRNEGQRISDVIGLESLVDEIAHAHISESNEAPTSSTILGPFWSPNAPFRENGDSIIQSPAPHGDVSLMHGRVLDLETKKPIADAVVDIWQASTNGKYDFQDPENQSDNNLRGKFRTDVEGRYHFYCLHPTPYSLPTDGPAGLLLNLLDRHPMRPAHIHLMISHPDHIPVTTQLFPSDDQYLKTDSVFAVKDDLLIDFKPLKGDPKATLEFEYNIVLPQRASKPVPEIPALLKQVDAGAPATTNGLGANGHATNGRATNGHATNGHGANGAKTNGNSTTY